MLDLASAFIGVVFVFVAGAWIARRQRTIPAIVVVLAGLALLVWAITRSIG